YEANRTIRQFQFLLQVSVLYSSQFFTQLAPANLIAVTAPIHAKVLGSPTTIRQQLVESRLVSPVFSGAFRRMIRPAGKLARRVGLNQGGAGLASVVTALNDGRVTPAPPRGVPDGIPSLEDLAKAIQPRSFPAWLRWLIDHRILALVIILMLLLIFGLASG